MPDLYMVFDVESIGLHGEGFAVGYVVIDRDGKEFAQGRYSCDPERATGDADGRDWVGKNCPPMPSTHALPLQVRTAFWNQWIYWKERGAVLVADCAWPVEARFLARCVDDSAARTWEGPYPLHELASFMVAAGMDPMATYDRLPDEPQHDPLGDAKQSARLLMTALNPQQPVNVLGSDWTWRTKSGTGEWVPVSSPTTCQANGIDATVTNGTSALDRVLEDTMPTNAYLLTFDTDRTVQPEDRHALKDFLGEYLRVTHGIDAPVAVDHLDPGEPTVQALLQPA